MIESIKRLYEKRKINTEQINKMLKDKKITQSEFERIVSGGD
jgi:hypothetical protein